MAHANAKRSLMRPRSIRKTSRSATAQTARDCPDALFRHVESTVVQSVTEITRRINRIVGQDQERCIDRSPALYEFDRAWDCLVIMHQYAVHIGQPGFDTKFAHLQRASSVLTSKWDNVAIPNAVVSATSVASRPVAIRIRPMRGVLCLASTVCQWPPK